MTPAKELPIIIEKSQEEVEQIVALVHSSNLPERTKPFVIGCINLASWIPKALVEHKVTISNLKRLIFGKGAKTTRKLYRIPPGILVNIKGHNLASVNKYWIEKLRCALCNEVFPATIPKQVCKEKYHPSFKAMLALQKYYMAMPFHRQDYFQSLLGFPIAASTQWQLMEELASCVLLVFPTLEKIAANGSLIHNDDTVVRIVDVIRNNRQNPGQKRTGMYTTGILAQNGTHKIALFYNSKRHSGENMARLLNKRDKNKGQVIQMCDALSHNLPANHRTIVCNCLSHGFRKFEELLAFYPEHCQTLMKYLSTPFQVDEKSKQLGHNEQQRLLYHQTHSQLSMLKAKAYMEDLLSTKQIEPNESLGKAINYMLKHWDKLTRFLSVSGAPVHNNNMEQGLKIPIRGRNNWLFYKTEYGAMVGGVLTSIIYTCELANVNPFEYLVALQVYKDHIVKEPTAWLPWSYANTTALLESSMAA
ncbi:Transposase [Legionella massiliensis]|uniref:Transposase n=2 Tax=Legionella massiliensis TaxID=1034943 RepID=A0A078KUT1_9GAMM|nr:transposase [Legionella massiliensis]CDZ76806.1 Transposase [Legionella massiliensis]CEE12544.1 Transposase IS66 family protein [Legionella massiliensis]